MAALLSVLREAGLHARGRVLTEEEGSQLASDAARHGLSAYVLHLVDAAGVVMSAASRQQLERDARAIVGTGLRLKTLLTRALDALAKEGVTPVVLKGYGLGARVYPDPLHRPSTDVDLLVPPEELERSERALRNLGMQPMEEAAEQFHREHHHHLTFRSSLGSVELHFRPITGFGTAMEGDGQFERATAAKLVGRDVRFLAPEDEVAYLAAHASQHLLQRLAWLVDLQLLIAKRPAIDWDGVAGAAVRSQMQVPVFLALWAAREHLGALVPERVLEQLAGSRWRKMVARRMFDERALLGATLSSKHRYVSYAALSLFSSDTRHAIRFAGAIVARGMRRKAAQLFPRITPSRWRG